MPTCPGPSGVTGELVTPTAAALLLVLTGVNNQAQKVQRGDYWQPKVIAGRPPSMLPIAVGLGAGTKDFEKHPNVLRLILGDCSTQTHTNTEIDADKGTSATASNDDEEQSNHIENVSTEPGDKAEEGKNLSDSSKHYNSCFVITFLQIVSLTIYSKGFQGDERY